jgi:hypothetical protein
MADRRANEVRRISAERRKRQRGLTDLVTVVEISGSDLRVALLRKLPDDELDRVEAVTVTWRKEAALLNSEEGLLELSAALCKLVEKGGSQESQFHFVLGGELCVTRAICGTTEEVRTELRQIEERSRLYHSLGPGEKVMVANSRPIDARHQYAVASICNRRTLSTVHDAALKAGIQIESIEPALVSVSRAVSRLKDAPTEPCLLMYVDDNSVEVGVCHQGRLLLDYRPGGLSDPGDIGRVVHTHLSRLQRHSGRQLNDSTPTLRRVYLCGGREAIARAIFGFAAYQEFEVCEISPSSIRASWKISDQVKDSAIVPALGTLLSTYVSSEEQDAPNFMQHVVASTREPIRPILIRSLIPLAAVLLLGVAGWLLNFRLQAEVDMLQQQVVALQPAQAHSLELRLKLTAAEEKFAQLNHLVQRMQPSPVREVIARIGHCMPSDVWLRDLTVEDMKQVKLSGSSFLEAGVFDFVRWLEQSPGFEDVALQSTRPSQSGSGPTIDFIVELNLGDIDGSVREVARND